jgi:protein-S-isoprenylcysteine O-methyltransferase Ste14
MAIQTSSSLLLKKIVSIIFFLLLFYVLPLIGKPELILTNRVIFLAAVCAVLFATQPRLSIRESKEKKASDKNTVWLIIIVSGIGQVVSLIDWAYFTASETAQQQQPAVIVGQFQDIDWGIAFNFSEVVSGFCTVIGIILLITGTLFRLYAINVLGKYFSSIVQIKEGHTIIKNGPYSLLRHPSYTGAYAAMIGCSFLLQSFTGFLILGIGMLFVYYLRIQTEERTLKQQFGNAWFNYSRQTWKMFPYIW